MLRNTLGGKMIHKFSVSNYGPFRERIEFDFTAGKPVDSDSRFFVAPSGTILSKALVFFGANGSGKTKALQAWSFFRWFLLHSFRTVDKDSKIVQLDPFRFQDDSEQSRSEFACTFETNGDVYRLEMVISREKVLYEALKKKPIKKSTKWPYLYRWNNKLKSDIKLREPFNKYSAMMGNRLNCTVFSRLRATDDNIVTCIAEVFGGYDNLGILGRSRTTDLEKLIDVAEVYHENPEQLENVCHVMETLGMQMDGITIKPATVISEGESVDVFIPVSQYLINEKTYELQMIFESDGTKAVFTILDPILDALDNGSVLILDELDQDMHPNLVQSLIAVMLEKAYNRSNCQIVCSTHCVEILDKLHKNQIYLVERNNSTYESTISRLSDFSGVTNKDNFKAKYLAGAFGAIPEQY